MNSRVVGESVGDMMSRTLVKLSIDGLRRSLIYGGRHLLVFINHEMAYLVDSNKIQEPSWKPYSSHKHAKDPVLLMSHSRSGTRYMIQGECSLIVKNIQNEHSGVFLQKKTFSSPYDKLNYGTNRQSRAINRGFGCQLAREQFMEARRKLPRNAGILSGNEYGSLMIGVKLMDSNHLCSLSRD